MLKTKQTITPARILLLLIVLVGIYTLLPQLGSFAKTFAVLRHASWLWLIIGFVLGFIIFFASGITQFAAGNLIGRFWDIMVLQFAGSFIDHFLPVSIGAVNLNARYYIKLGKRQTQAIAIAATPIIFGIITTVIMVAIVSPITLAHLADKLHASYFSIFLTLPVLAVLVILVLLILLRYKKRATKFIRIALDALKVIKSSQQLTLLLAGSLAITFTSTLALLASIMAAHAHVGLISVFVIYVTSSLVSSIVPTPGGVGATEAVLVVTLVAAGPNLAQAVAITLIYRFFTFWLPIIPGALAFRRLNQLKI